ncbi:MAG: tetratricopeptide repeat protein [Deltaproteobacteria bacterium]|nr:tetratricopeptide repeat protein [Deltaproteobacteria bacterium]
MMPAFFVTLGFVAAAAGAPSFESANRAYLAGNYRDAATEYEALLKNVPNADVAFNLGNAHAKTGDWARARAAYEKALRIRPRHADAAHNLSWVKKELERSAWSGDEMREEVVPFWVDFPLRFSPAESEILLLVSSLLLFGLLIALRFVVRRGLRVGLFFGALVSLLLFVAAFALWGGRRYAERWNRAAIVVAREATFRLGPSEREDAVAVVRAGRKVRVIEAQGDWFRVPWPGGLSIFVRRQDVVGL